jgi:Tfp pilus assembly protein PilF
MCFRRALAGSEVFFRPNHVETLEVNNLGMVQADRGRLSDAESCYRRAWAGMEAFRGPDHPDTIAIVNNVGLICWKQGKPAGAETYLSQSLTRQEAAFGPQHARVARNSSNAPSSADFSLNYQVTIVDRHIGS